MSYHIICRDMLYHSMLCHLPTVGRSFVVHPVSITRFPSFRTQTLENLSVDSVKDGFLSNPDPGENLVSGNLVLETWYSGSPSH